ncbi:hypothetical protein FRC07_013578, partial [Ceratobasidium sp. 392]
LNGLGVLEVGMRQRTLGTALNWRIWVGWEVARESVAPAQTAHNHPSPAHSNVSAAPSSMFGRASIYVVRIRIPPSPCFLYASSAVTSVVNTRFASDAAPRCTPCANAVTTLFAKAWHYPVPRNRATIAHRRFTSLLS